MKLFNQPPQSPDLNALDLGFFNSIQALQQKTECQTIDELVCAVTCAFNELSPATLDKTFSTLQRVMKSCLSVDGDNSYEKPRSKSFVQDGANQHDLAALVELNLRLEEEDRLDEICNLVNNVAIDGDTVVL
ncbi:hypothetical protein LEN26_002322 [Aphanomyces euteiches]|nr:hypothetical protein AeMF1_004906 [Aphanomyces euteiches]KAH9141751.1 hypothetical protein LEN26_005195 [Aphanomyces euteiches]KAH9159470.1 hypothetical protein LEN26_002322 [Aphanomyces euteiches]